MQSREVSRKRTTKGMWHLNWILRYTGISRQIVRERFQREETEQKRRKRHQSCACLWGQRVQQYLVTSGGLAFTQSMVGNGLPQVEQQRIHLQCRRHRRCGFDPWVGKISWRRAWQTLQYSSLENFMESQTQLKWLSTQAHGRERLDSKLFNTHLTPGSVNKVTSSYAEEGIHRAWTPS